MTVTRRGAPSLGVQPTLPSIVTLVQSKDAEARIRTALRARATIVAVDTVLEASRAVRHATPRPRAVIVEARDRNGTRTAGLVRALVRGHLPLPVIGYCRTGTQYRRDVLALVQAGAHDLVFHEVDDTGLVLRTVLDEAEQVCAADELLQQLEPIVPPRLRPFFSYCLTFPEQAQRVSDIALALGVNRRTLVNQCREVGYPPPIQLVSWCRLMLVGFLLATTHETVEGVALRLEFPSVNALRNMTRRYVRLRPLEVREAGGHRAVLRAFCEAVGCECGAE